MDTFKTNSYFPSKAVMEKIQVRLSSRTLRLLWAPSAQHVQILFAAFLRVLNRIVSIEKANLFLTCFPLWPPKQMLDVRICKKRSPKAKRGLHWIILGIAWL